MSAMEVDPQPQPVTTPATAPVPPPAPAPEPAAATDPAPAPTIAPAAILQAQIQTLASLSERVQNLRQAPTLLLQRPSNTGSLGAAGGDALNVSNVSLPDMISLPSLTQSLRKQLDDLHTISETVKSENVQNALKMAQGSEEADNKDIPMGSWRADRAKPKKPRAASPESPQPYIQHQPSKTSTFPPLTESRPAVSANGLVAYLRAFNAATSTTKLQIRSSLRARPQNEVNAPVHFGDTIVLRFAIQDVLNAFVTLDNGGAETPLIVESVACFGPREKKSPHAHSDYLVFLKLSQQIAKVLRQRPTISVQQLLHLMRSYEGLFVDRCSRCQRILSAEGHIPPVARVWLPDGLPANLNSSAADQPPSTTTINDEDVLAGPGKWDPRHANCIQD